MKFRVVWANLFLETFLDILAFSGTAVLRWYWTDSLVKNPERGQMDAIVELKSPSVAENAKHR